MSFTQMRETLNYNQYTLPVRYTGELTLKALTYVCKSKNMETKGGGGSIWNHHKCVS